ncbi:MAG: type II toxin-antitoxin system HicA family toxin [Chloroflexi bacterium]|nr:type II toxin-antitoxin system HicA family toxin [Chloroflexota bacterium]
MRLPRVSGKQAEGALLRAGFVIHRISGSHHILKHPETGRRVTIPFHRRELAPKTLRSVLKQAAISADTFAELL